MPGVSFGAELPDRFASLTAAVSTQLSYLSDARDFFAARSALEKEYAGKLQALVRRATEKRSKRLQGLCVGDEPTKTWTEAAAAENTLDAAFATILSATDEAAQAHYNLGERLNVEVAEEIGTAVRKKEEIRKKHTAFAVRLLSERDKVYADRAKAKQKYDDDCGEVDSHRQKQDKAGASDKHAERAARQYEQAQVDMLNSKNSYLISVAVANRAKEKFYREDLPTLHDNLQSLWTLTTSRFAALLSRSNLILTAHLDTLKAQVSRAETVVQAVDPEKDQQLYVEWNKRPWSEPAAFEFEPCSGFFDTAEWSTTEASRTYLQNIALRSRKRIVEVRPVIESKRREIAGLENLRDAYSQDVSLGDADEVMDNLLESLRQTILLESVKASLETELEAVKKAVGDDEGDARPHRFKPASFTIPTSCNYCGASIWGIAKQGLTCKPCGYTCHAKCEMKVPADCPGTPVKRGHSRHGSKRLAPSGSLRSPPSPSSSNASSDPSASSMPSTPSYTSTTTGRTSYSSPRSAKVEEEVVKGRVLYSYDATSPFELSISEGDVVTLIEADDGSGWVKVKLRRSTGLVPATYVAIDGAPEPAPTAAADDQSTGSGAFVRALYDYQAQDPEDELSLVEGELIELTVGGETYGEGWYEGIKAGRRGIFPSNYCEKVN